jgi:hypothetical protein
MPTTVNGRPALRKTINRLRPSLALMGRILF